MQVIIDREILDEVETTVTQDEFAQYLLSHTVNFATCAFIVQTLLDAVEKARENLEENNEQI